MLETIEKAHQFVAPFDDAKSFFYADDQLHFHAVTHLVLAIGEESKNIGEELKNQFPEIPWRLMANMRNRLAHDYRGIDFHLVYSVTKDDLPPLKEALIKMLTSISYDKGELQAALHSEYYKHLSYLHHLL